MSIPQGTWIVLASALSLAILFNATPVRAELDLVTSDANGMELPADETNPSGFAVEDVSADGRYVLITNTLNVGVAAFGPGSSPFTPVQPPEACTHLRKDRQTGDLITVFADTDETTSDKRSEFC